MNGGFAVIDADRHIMEPEDLWDRYLEPAFKGRVSIAPGRTRRLVDGQPVSDNVQAPGGGGMSRDTRYREVYADAVAHDFDPASNLRAMDREGVDVAVDDHGCLPVRDAGTVGRARSRGGRIGAWEAAGKAPRSGACG